MIKPAEGNEILRITYRWLSLAGIKISREMWNEQLLTHPDYPALSAIKDGLEKFSIPSSALRISEDELLQLNDSTPFLTRIKSSAGTELVCIKSVSKDVIELISDVNGTKVIPFNKFLLDWTNIVILLENNLGLYNRKIVPAKEKQLQNILLFILFLFLLCIGFITFLQGIILAILFTIGLIAGYLILLKELGVDTTLSRALCNSESKCDAVLHSSANTIYLGIKMSDLVIAYFSISLFICLLLPISNSLEFTKSLLLLLNSSALPFVGYSIYSQVKLRAYCQLCLAVIFLVTTEFALLLSSNSTFLYLNEFSNNVYMVVWGATVPVLIVMAMKKFLSIKTQLSNTRIKYLRAIRNIDNFDSILKAQKRINTKPLSNDLTFGEVASKVKIVLAINLFCLPCAKTHKILDDLIKEYSNEIYVTIRFKIDFSSWNSPNNIVVKSLLLLCRDRDDFGKRKVLGDWFRLLSYKKFSSFYQIDNTASMDDELRQHEAWFRENEIAETPMIAINDYKMPDSYALDDLTLIVFDLIRYYESTDYSKQNIKIHNGEY